MLNLDSIYNVKSLFFLSLLLCFSMSCTNTYEKRFTKCLENFEVREFTVVKTGKTGYGYSNTDSNCLLGAPLPKFEIADIDGNIISTKNLKGKINVINFWFIKCRPCVAEIPSFNTLYKKYNSDEFNFLAITRDSLIQLKPFLEEHPFNFTIIPNAKELIRNKFHIIYGYPFTLITDKKNRIIGTINRGTPEATLARIDSILTRVGLIHTLPTK